MNNKVLLALIDGMRPDEPAACGHPFYARLRRESAFCLSAKAASRFGTPYGLASIFSGAEPALHGGRNFRPQPGILETVHDAGGKTAVMMTRESSGCPGRADSIDRLEMLRGDVAGRPLSDTLLFERDWAKRTAGILSKNEYDFVFWHFAAADMIGRAEGHGSKGYLDALYCAGECLDILFSALPDAGYAIVTAGHGQACGGSDDLRDAKVPIYCAGAGFAAGTKAEDWRLIDIAPTISALLTVETPAHYQGRSLL